MKDLKQILTTDNLTTLAGFAPALLAVAHSFGLTLTDDQRNALSALALAVIGYYTAKKNESL